MNPAKTAEPIEMPFRMLRRMDPENHILDWSADAPTGMALLGSVWCIAKHRNSG